MNSKYIKQHKQLAMGKNPTVATTGKGKSSSANTKSSGQKAYGMAAKGNVKC